ncbi:hypothetical protein RJ639_005795 [Escallonia herrerae]|uniref:F-box domain-containing protein n=1 Tax=Escallonia herrerae TaxID=1293975 RepID=A0AA89AUM7_9ASTE|nr:hypothetical protein RJ639_005795 [Escallonia herrerae]
MFDALNQQINHRCPLRCVSSQWRDVEEEKSKSSSHQRRKKWTGLGRKEKEDIAKSLACDLPGEIMMDILSRLPVKYLVQYKCISKGWHALVKNPLFISMHSRKSASRKEECYLILRRHNDCKVTETLLLHDEESVCRQTCVAHQSTYCLVGAWNGLLCVTPKADTFGDAYMLLNPATREFKPAFKYDSPGEARSKPPQILTLGFGFDSMTNDYKIVRIERSEASNQMRSYCELYSERTNS